jgi:hypothetical protein
MVARVTVYEEEFRNLYSSLIIIRVIKSRRVIFTGLIKCMGEMRSSYRILDLKPE